MLPWDHPFPPVLYKYRPAAWLDVLTDCRVRFSHRTVFEDDHELQPDYAIFGTESEIWRYALSIGFPLKRNGLSAAEMVVAMATDPRAQKVGIEGMKNNVRARDEMWTEYAGSGTGFVVGFDTAHAGFERLTTPGRLGKVSYSDEPFGSAL